MRIKTVAAIAGASLTFLALALAANVLRLPSRQQGAGPSPSVAVDDRAAAARLAGALRFKTIAGDIAEGGAGPEFERLHAYLQHAFPSAHRAMRREVVAQYSLLYSWEGSDPSAEPLVLIAHQDVVPVAPGTERDWHAPPFGGQVVDGFIVGRGAWDNKGNLMAIMEAVEALSRNGGRPRRTVYLVFGHDEEANGLQGASAIAQLLTSRGVKAAFALDEGLLVTQGITPGVKRPVALIGVAEKGYATMQLRVKTAPGHSSMPPPLTAVGALAQAIERLQSAAQPATIDGVVATMFETLAPDMTGFDRVVFSNLWLFSPLVQAEMLKKPSTHAMLHTTVAPTVFQAGNKDNVLPAHAQASVNFRLKPGQSLVQLTEHVRKTIGNEAVSATLLPGASDPSRVAGTDKEGYQAIHSAIKHVFPDSVVAPGLMIGATDSRHFAGIARDIYRFSPVFATSADLPRFHGTDEKISVKNYGEMIKFYYQLLSDTAASAPGKGAAQDK